MIWSFGTRSSLGFPASYKRNLLTQVTSQHVWKKDKTACFLSRLRLTQLLVCKIHFDCVGSTFYCQGQKTLGVGFQREKMVLVTVSSTSESTCDQSRSAEKLLFFVGRILCRQQDWNPSEVFSGKRAQQSEPAHNSSGAKR